MAEQQQGGAWPHGARETEEHPWATPGQQQPAFPVGAPPPTLQHYQHELEQQLQHQLVWQLQCSAMLQAVPPPELGWPAGGAASAQFQPPSPLDQLSHLSYQIDPQMQPAPQPQQVQMNQQYLHDMQQQRPAALPQSVSAAMPPFNPSLTPQFTPSWPPRAPGGHGAAVGGSRLSPRAQVPPPHPLSRRLSEEGRSQAGSSRDDSQHGRGEESRRGEESSRSEGAGATSDEIRIAAFLSQACQTGGGRCGEGGGRSSPATAGGARPSTPGGTRATPDSGGGQPYERPPCAPAPSSSDPSSVSDPRASSAPGVSVSPGVAAGVIFGCNNETYDECFELSMVGLPRKYMPLAHSVRAGYTLLFLFNFSSRMLHGVYRATSDGADNLHAAAFTGASPARDVDSLLPSELEAGSPFPAQCCFEIAEELSPCPESEFRHVLEYTERQRFRFKLSRWQCADLISAMARHQGHLRAAGVAERLRLGSEAVQRLRLA